VWESLHPSFEPHVTSRDACVVAFQRFCEEFA
jgi:hypothetical protein